MAHPKALNDTPDTAQPGQPQTRNPTTPGDLPPLQFFARTVHAETSLGGVRFSENQRLVMNLAAANRDPRQFDDPESFDADRPRNPHVAFGGGLHSCQGQHIARAEMRAVLRVLLTRLPDVHLTGEVGEAGVLAGLMAVISLPVAFTPERSQT